MSDEGSWAGGGGGGAGARGGDIIDLDQYMRGARPPRGTSEWAPGEASSTACGSETEPSESTPSQSRGARDKPHSHDSGLSDDSYRPRRRKHRRPPFPSARPAVARRDHGDRAPPCPPRHQVFQLSDESSELSSSSGATPRHRTDIKTYKIIMTKLDELNHMLSGRVPPARAPSPPGPAGSAGWGPPALRQPRQSARAPRQGVQRQSATQLTLTPLRTLALSISPQEARAQRHNVLLESVVQCDSEPGAPPAPPSQRGGSCEGGGEGGGGAEAGAKGLRRSMCTRCRQLWRALTFRA